MEYRQTEEGHAREGRAIPSRAGSAGRAKAPGVAPVTLLAWIVSTAAFVAGCNPLEFDKLKDKAPVRLVGTPEGLDSFKPAVVTLDRDVDGNLERDTVVVGGWGDAAVVSIRVRDDGKASRRSGGEPAVLDEEHLGEVTAVAQTVDYQDEGGEPVPTVLAGAPSSNIVFLVLMPPGGSFQTRQEIVMDPTMARNFGGAVAVGDMGTLDASGPDTGDEWIVTSDQTIYVFYGEPKNMDDYHRCQVCPVAPCGNYEAHNHSIALGRFFSDQPVGGPVAAAVGIPGEMHGKVSLVRFTEDATPENGCIGGLTRVDLAAPDGTPQASERFGTSILAADLNGDDLDDLVVGAPDLNRVYVYLNPTGDASGLWSDASPVYEIEPHSDYASDAVMFGSSLTLVDVDGDGQRELAVGDPEAVVGGRQGAGRVHVYKLWDANGALDPTWAGTVYEFEPKTGARLGLALSAVVLGADQWQPDAAGVYEELVAVGYDQVFIFYLTGVEDDVDPR